MTRKAPVQANRTLATVRKMFAWALEWGIVESNPASGISKPSHEQPKERSLRMMEIATFWANADWKDDLQSLEIVKVLKLTLLTGCRPGEILALNWENVKGRWAELPGTSTKNKRPHRVFLSTLALQVMGKTGKGPVIKRYEGATIAVFTLSCWLRREKYLELPSWTPHDLRRTCATHLAANETPPHVVQRILNHANRGITAQVYNQYSYAKEIEVALEMLAGKIREGIAADPAQGVVVLAEYKEEKMAAATNG